MVRLGPDRRSVLGILADAPYGLTEAILLAHCGGFDRRTIDSLISDGLVNIHSGSATSDGQRTGPRLKITDAGRRVLDSG
jgi:hypothetical protein